MKTMTGLFLAFLQIPGATRAAAEEPAHLTAGGWVFLVSAWTFILVLVYYTFSKVLRGGK